MGLLDWVDPTREWFQSRPRAAKGLLDAAYSLATDPNVRKEAMARQPAPFSEGSGQSMFDAAMNVGPQGLLGKIVYHGSPHKFDKFDASKIGTGEGAQAYGHGVYLADSEKVAKGYRDTLAGTNYPTFRLSNDGGKVQLWDQRNWKKMGEFLTKEEAEAAAQKIVDAIPEKGALYKADLPDEWIPKMLDWDKPLYEQSDEVKKALSYLAGDKKSPLTGDTAKQVAALLDSKEKWNTGEGLAKLFGWNQKEFSDVMSSAGIPGIRYLDGGSRPKNIVDAGLMRLYDSHGGNAKAAVDEFMSHVYESPKEKAKMHAHFMKQLENAPTYNYVVFPGLEDKVKILERNGVPLGLLGEMP